MQVIVSTHKQQKFHTVRRPWAMIAVLSVLAAFSQGAMAHGKADGAAKTAATQGVYTPEQARRGENLYFENCAVCHGGALQGLEENPPLSGRLFVKKWTGGPLAALYGYINTQMPLGQPGVLGAAGTADVVAYILSGNGFVAGTKELPADIKALRNIKTAPAQ